MMMVKEKNNHLLPCSTRCFVWFSNRTLLTGLARPYALETCGHCWNSAANIWQIHHGLRMLTIDHCETISLPELPHHVPLKLNSIIINLPISFNMPVKSFQNWMLFHSTK
jgi:hypothetical protein